MRTLRRLLVHASCLAHAWLLSASIAAAGGGLLHAPVNRRNDAPAVQGRSVDARRFPHHTEVRQYLEAFADHFGVRDAVQLNTRVTDVRPVADAAAVRSEPDSSPTAKKWEVRTQPTPQPGEDSSTAMEAVGVYDAVMVCNGHYSSPRTPGVPGMQASPCKCEHSHSYRRPDVYSGKRVLIVGAHASGAHIMVLQAEQSIPRTVQCHNMSLLNLCMPCGWRGCF